MLPAFGHFLHLLAGLLQFAVNLFENYASMRISGNHGWQHNNGMLLMSLLIN